MVIELCCVVILPRRSTCILTTSSYVFIFLHVLFGLSAPLFSAGSDCSFCLLGQLQGFYTATTCLRASPINAYAHPKLSSRHKNSHRPTTYHSLQET
ncbi:hypothetical protein BP00DRAFT_119170 [Aspergillus indologenus CBS 114.80]|uniref:Uncharacterized protein n=1 Tax=Aspergillus indologenus CBS 114.80 TaxID=1450541 RepID=A0A2V5HL30_9EURO|nr:hypothetical protein BP00DRAFT_119170 [Aspergillus indologenus CBS 114.80]